MEKREEENKRLLRIGVIGAVLTALCCFTPVLVILYGALGLTALKQVIVED